MVQFFDITRKFVFIIPFCIILPAFFLLSFFDTSLTIFPCLEYRDRISVFDDNKLGGNSEIIDFSVLDSKIIVTSILRKSRVSSFAGVGIDVSILDISSFDIMELRLNSSSPACYLIYLMTFIDGESTLSKLDTIAHFKKEVDVSEKNHVYRIKVNSFIETDHERTVKKKKGPGKRPTNLLFINLLEIIKAEKGDDPLSYDKNKTIIIEEISFHRTYFSYYITLAAATVLYYGVCILFLLFGKTPMNLSAIRKIPDLPVIRLDVESYSEKDLKKIMHTLQQNVSNPEFSIHMLYDMTGLYKKKVIRIIKENYGLSFKQLLNFVRLNEAKGLLLQSNLTIYDIAFKIGYNDNTYFSKLFKKQFGMTPKEYRSGNGRVII